MNICDLEEEEKDHLTTNRIDDEEEVKDEFIKTPSNNSDDENETKITDKAKGDEDEEMDYTTSKLYDDVDIRLNEPVGSDKRFVQEEGTDAAMTNVQQGNKNLEILQVIEDAHVTLSTVPHKTEVPVTSSSHSSDLAAKFLNFSNIPHTDAEIVSPMDVHVHHEVPSKQTPTLLSVPVSVITTNPQSALPNFASVFQLNNRVTAWEKEVAELKKDPLHTQVTTLVDDHLDAMLGATRDEFMNRLSVSITARVTKNPTHEFELKKILINTMDKSESYLAAPEHRECYEGLIKSYDLDKTIFSTYDRGLKKRKTSKDTEPAKGPKAKESQSGLSKGDKSQSKSSGKSVQSEEPEFDVTDLDMPQDQMENPGNDDEEPKEKTPQQGQNHSWLMTLASSAGKSSKTFDKLMITPIDFSAFIMNDLKINNHTQETLLGPTFRILKGTHSNYAELEYDFEECYKALSEKLNWENPEGGDYLFYLTKPLPLVMTGNRGVSAMTYTTSITNTKVAQYDLPGIEDMVPNIWVPVKPAYDKQVEVMRKHVYGYLKEIVVRRADDAFIDLRKQDRKLIDYRIKRNKKNTNKEIKANFPRLRINDIEDMLLLIVHNQLTNLSGNDVSDFAIALRMFTRSLVI
ncbi:hypothetical protein Tco_1493378 [Tanacetum coccineum]